ncbi:unnamed protein product [Symbiodinium sp. CCMP2456]|nr:unnamed protein product [Symbiodinium sp. CCMP2456]
MAVPSVGSQVRFVYRSTFIDEEKDFADESSRKRCQSLPPIKTGLETATEVVTNETALSGYVEELVQSAQHLGKAEAQAGPAVETSSQVITSSTSAQGPPSLGSRGHPQLCKRPCIFSVGSCSSGSSCSYCHHSHPDKTAKLDKSQRKRFAELDIGIALLLLHDLMRTKALENGFSEEAVCLLSLVEEEARAQNPGVNWAEEVISHRRLQRAGNESNSSTAMVLNRMPFHQLAVLAGTKSGNPAFAKELQALVDTLSERVEALQGAGNPQGA